MPESSVPRRSSGLLAIVAVIGFVLLWWLLSGNGPQGPDGNDPVLAVPDVDATGTPGATATPVPIALSNGLRLEGYDEEGDELVLSLTVPEGTCPDLETPRVIESDVSVTVTVTHSTEPECAALTRSRSESVSVRLDSPLGGRSVLDGALAQQVRLDPVSSTD